MTCQSPYLSENHHAHTHSTGPPALALPVSLHRHQCAHTSSCDMPCLPPCRDERKVGKRYVVVTPLRMDTCARGVRDRSSSL